MPKKPLPCESSKAVQRAAKVGGGEGGRKEQVEEGGKKAADDERLKGKKGETPGWGIAPQISHSED